jgi:hypothetical protein
LSRGRMKKRKIFSRMLEKKDKIFSARRVREASLFLLFDIYLNLGVILYQVVSQAKGIIPKKE